jgi:hypothetical protein
LTASLSEFFRDNASAVFALLGAAGGGLLSFLGSWLLRKREYDLRLWEKLLDRRVSAHEAVILTALEMRVMVPSGRIDKQGDAIRAPSVLLSRETFEEWFQCAQHRTASGTTWLTVTAKRELNFVQDYLLTLYMHLQKVPSAEYPLLGVIVRDDFVKLSSELEKCAFLFFESDIRKLKAADLRSWHKYPHEETQRRLKETNLIRRCDEVAALWKN